MPTDSIEFNSKNNTKLRWKVYNLGTIYEEYILECLNQEGYWVSTTLLSSEIEDAMTHLNKLYVLIDKEIYEEKLDQEPDKYIDSLVLQTIAKIYTDKRNCDTSTLCVEIADKIIDLIHKHFSIESTDCDKQPEDDQDEWIYINHPNRDFYKCNQKRIKIDGTKPQILSNTGDWLPENNDAWWVEAYRIGRYSTTLEEVKNTLEQMQLLEEDYLELSTQTRKLVEELLLIEPQECVNKSKVTIDKISWGRLQQLAELIGF